MIIMLAPNQNNTLPEVLNKKLNKVIEIFYILNSGQSLSKRDKQYLTYERDTLADEIHELKKEINKTNEED